MQCPRNRSRNILRSRGRALFRSGPAKRWVKPRVASYGGVGVEEGRAGEIREFKLLIEPCLHKNTKREKR